MGHSFTPCAGNVRTVLAMQVSEEEWTERKKRSEARKKNDKKT
jgi:hypothetical protein